VPVDVIAVQCHSLFFNLQKAGVEVNQAWLPGGGGGLPVLKGILGGKGEEGGGRRLVEGS